MNIMKCIKCNIIELNGKKIICSTCKKNALKNYREKNKEKMKEYCKIYYNNNREVILEHIKKKRIDNYEYAKIKEKLYRKRNPEKKACADKVYYEKNKDKITIYKKEWAQKNKQRVNELGKKRYANNKYKHNVRILSHTIQIPDGQICELCNEKLAVDRHHPNYFEPLKIIFICKSCHSKIHMKYILIKEDKKWRLAENDLSYLPIQ